MSTAYATVVPVTTQTVRPAAREARSETRTVDGVKAVITYATPGVPVTDEEIRAYIRRGNLQNMNTIVDGLNLVVDGEEVEITYSLADLDGISSFPALKVGLPCPVGGGGADRGQEVGAALMSTPSPAVPPRNSTSPTTTSGT